MAFRQPTTLRAVLAFTLVELLVVLGILAVLASILLATLSLAKKKAQNIQCLNNIRQINITWAVYNFDNNKLVANGFQNEGAHPESPYWIQGYLNHLVSKDLTNNSLLLDNRYALFADYLQSVKVYKCPSDKSLFQLKNSSNNKQLVTKHRSYALNWHLGMYEYRYGFKEGDYILKDSQIFSPVSTFNFIDVNPESICWSLFGVNEDNHIFMYPNSAHSGAGNVAFADGHVISKKWKDFRTKKGSDQWHVHADKNENNVDFVWLRERRGVN